MSRETLHELILKSLAHPAASVAVPALFGVAAVGVGDTTLGGHQAGQVVDQFPGYVEHGRIGDHVGSFW
jgi:hypothetical protein